MLLWLLQHTHLAPEPPTLPGTPSSPYMEIQLMTTANNLPITLYASWNTCTSIVSLKFQLQPERKALKGQVCCPRSHYWGEANRTWISLHLSIFLLWALAVSLKSRTCLMLLCSPPRQSLITVGPAHDGCLVDTLVWLWSEAQVHRLRRHWRPLGTR